MKGPESKGKLRMFDITGGRKTEIHIDLNFIEKLCFLKEFAYHLYF